ncbi:MAG: nitroreductase family protein [Firmicutes bacterium]|nr:nitroreductase family protein [Bacillota bacterium]
MEFYDVVHRRRAVRRYRSDPVPKEALARIFDAANWAPSGMNKQQWEFLVVSGGKLAQMGDSYGKIAEGYTASWDDDKERQRFINFAKSFGGAPMLVVALAPASSNPAMRKMHLESVSAALENLLLAACAEGLGTCWMTGPLNDEPALRRILEVPEEKEFVAVTPLGYPAQEAPPPPRVDPDMSVKVRYLD